MTFQLPIKISHSKLLKTYWELKRQAYASGGKYEKTLSGTEQFTARKGRWIFSDEYAGNYFFHGIESLGVNVGRIAEVYKEIPVAGMIYRGEIRKLPTIVKPDIFPKMTNKQIKKYIFRFLRKALLAAPPEQPFRGPLTRKIEQHGVEDPPFKHRSFPHLLYRNIPEWKEYWLGEKQMKLPLSIGGTESITYHQGKSETNLYIGWWHFGLLLKNLDDIILT